MPRPDRAFLTLLRRFGVWIAVPVLAALLLYQPPGIEQRIGAAITPYSVPVVAASAKALTAKPAPAEPRVRAMTALPVADADLPVRAPTWSLLRLACGAPAIRLHLRLGWQARAPPIDLARRMI